MPLRTTLLGLNDPAPPPVAGGVPPPANQDPSLGVSPTITAPSPESAVTPPDPTTVSPPAPIAIPPDPTTASPPTPILPDPATVPPPAPILPVSPPAPTPPDPATASPPVPISTNPDPLGPSPPPSPPPPAPSPNTQVKVPPPPPPPPSPAPLLPSPQVSTKSPPSQNLAGSSDVPDLTPRPRQSPHNSSGSGHDLPIKAIVGIAGATLAVALVLLAVLYFCRKKKYKRDYWRDEESGPYIKGLGMYDRPGHATYPPKTAESNFHDHFTSMKQELYSPAPVLSPPPRDYNRSQPLSYSSSSESQDLSWKPLAPPPPPPSLTSTAATSSLCDSENLSFTYDQLQEATNEFSGSNLLGEGSYGFVYRGRLQNGKMIAVKQLKDGSGKVEQEFQVEAEIISRIRHKHLVSLLGYAVADSERILVYDYVPNVTLEYHLHRRPRHVMPWNIRMKIAIGSAHGLAYLHEDCRIIHRDIKSSNILLDKNFEAQVADFGLAKLTSDQYTHMTTRVMGTFGYLAPEYASSGKLTEKSDVYSFGVILLELITGNKPVDSARPIGDESLVEWARPYLSQALGKGEISENFVDERLEDYDENEMLSMVKAAEACVRYSASKRPKMTEVVHVLENGTFITGPNHDQL